MIESANAPDPDRIAHAASILDAFADDTGLTSDRTERRYLWTDAFAVCTWLGLHRRTGKQRHRELALALVDRVHRVLGRHRDDDHRTGWISGLDEDVGARHPTAGGLRIGKERPERGPEQRFDPETEWERDGQYYHYLTRWMHALNRAWRVTGEERYHRWAVELAEAAHEAFVVQRDPEAAGVHWKMSPDLSRSLVPTEGQHDPLDGLVTVRTLQATAPEGEPVLDEEEATLASICRGRRWQTDDPLGVGGLLIDAWRTAWLNAEGGRADEELLPTLLEDGAASLKVLARGTALSGPATRRLAFRELGLSLGLAAVDRLERLATGGGPEEESAPTIPAGPLDRLRRFLPLREEIESYWLDPEHREPRTWSEHGDINRVALAASLAPEGYLEI